MCALTPLSRKCGKFRIEWENWFRVVHNYNISYSACVRFFLQNDSMHARCNFIKIADRVKSCNSKLIFFFFKFNKQYDVFSAVTLAHGRRGAGDTYEIVYYITENIIVVFRCV